jgi:hypothetical protein
MQMRGTIAFAAHVLHGRVIWEGWMQACLLVVTGT